MSSTHTDVNNRVALVTGANSGLGFATSLALSKAGAKVIVACERDAESTVEAIKAAVPGAKVEAGPLLDLGKLDNIRNFANYVIKNHPKVHILINNAGVGKADGVDANGIRTLAQINVLGPYALTRLLEKRLVDSEARVVTVASIYHRVAKINDPKTFFHDASVNYKDTKLANVLFAFELHRRLGKHGVTSVAVDPGSVNTAIFNRSKAMESKMAPLIRAGMSFCWAPPADGAKTLIHAATVPWEKEQKKEAGALVPISQDLRYYTRGGFGSPWICENNNREKRLNELMWQSAVFGATFLDWPVRRFSFGLLANFLGPVKAAPAAYDEDLATKLWDTAADLSKLPRNPGV